MQPWALVLILLAAGADLPAELARCAAIRGATDRLDCYDQLARSGAGGTVSTTAPQPSPRALAAPPAPASSQCAATTKKGTRCSRRPNAGSSYCWQHGG